MNQARRLGYLRACAAAVCALGTGSVALAQTLQATVNRPVSIEIAAKPIGFNDQPCSVLVSFPDGTRKYLIASAPDYKVRTEFAPQTEGPAIIRWVGEGSLNGEPAGAVDGAVKQVFGNLGQILQGKPLTQAIPACAGQGEVRLAVVQTQGQALAQVAPEPAGTTNRSGLGNLEVEEGAKRFSERRFEDAFKLLVTPAENGQARAQGLLARMYMNGWGVQRNEVLGLEWAQKAAAANNPEGINIVAMVEKDPKERVRLFKRASDMGYTLAKVNLGRTYFFGQDGVPKNEAEGMRLLREAAAANHPLAQAFMGDRFASGTGGVSKSAADALKWYKLSAEQGFSAGQTGLGSMFLRGDGVNKDYVEALKWFKLAIDNDGNPAATAQLAYMYMNGFGVSKNAEEAFKLNLQAAQKGNPQAQANLGVQYRFGNGTAKDLEQAVIWLRKSAKAGNEFAKNQLDATELKPLIAKVEADELVASAKLEVKKQLEELERLKAQAAQQARETPPAPQPITVAQEVPAPAKILATRRALVIGNDTYKNVAKLINAREDARTIAANLTAVGYQVTLRLDLNEKEMKAALRNFASQVQGGDEVLFFFAGHGVQLGSTNYLLPIDILGDNEAQVRDEAIQLQRILDDMSEKKAKFTLAMIDACRDNPFKSSGRSLGGRGLAPTTAATGQMVIFSAGAGQQALDKLGPSDKSKNGLFTRVFVQEMQKSNQSVDRVVKNVRNQVAELAKSVGHEQVPAIYDQVLGDFYFRVDSPRNAR